MVKKRATWRGGLLRFTLCRVPAAPLRGRGGAASASVSRSSADGTQQGGARRKSVLGAGRG